MEDGEPFEINGFTLIVKKQGKFTGDVVLDGYFFFDCEFHDCTFIVQGEAPFMFQKSRLGTFTVRPVGRAYVLLAQLGGLIGGEKLLALIETLAAETRPPAALN